MRRSIPCLLSALLLAGQAGCAVKAPRLLPPPPSEELRSQLGTIGVVAGSFPPQFETAGAAKGAAEGALRGAGMGSAGTIGVLTALGSGYGLVLGILLAPVGGAVGTVVGAIKADPAAVIERHEAAARQVLASRALQEALRDRVTTTARAETRRDLVVLPERGPASAEAEARYAGLASEGIGTVLELRVDDVHLDGWGINPKLWLRLSTRTRLVRTTDEAEIYASSLSYVGGEHRTLEDWIAGDGEALRRELEQAYASLAEKIVDEIFLLMLFPARPGVR